MKKAFSLLLASLMVLALVACDNNTAEEPAATDEQAAAEPAEETEAPAEAEELPQVEVADDGTQFDPPVQPEQLPDGVYFCDMGTVHYARAQNTEHRCPLCNMMLTKKGGESAGGHGHDHDHEHGHDHDHDHAH